MRTTHDAPIACTLTGGAFAERLAWIAQLNHDGLRSHTRTASSLTLHYGAGVRNRVRELVRREGECCGFLMFGIDEAADEIRLTITLPDRAGELADQLLEPFLPA
jgi:hypothetical protein